MKPRENEDYGVFGYIGEWTKAGSEWTNFFCLSKGILTRIKYIEDVYARSFSEDGGRTALHVRVAFGAIYIKEQENLTDEGCVRYIQENPYAQYFLGLKTFQAEQLFDPSMMVHFRKCFPVDEIIKIDEYICLERWPERDEDGDDDPGPR